MTPTMKRIAVVVAVVLAASFAETAAQDAAKGVAVDKAKRTVTVEAKVAPRKLEHLKGEVYPIELIASWPHPRGKKAHETVLTFDVEPSAVHKAFEELGLKAGKPARGEGKAEGPVVTVFVEVPDGAGGAKKLPFEKVLIDPKTKKAPPKLTFHFTGSVMTAIDPNKPDDKKYGADLTGTLISLFPVTDETVLQTAWTMKEEKFLKLDVNPDALPKEGTPVKLVFEVPAR